MEIDNAANTQKNIRKTPEGMKSFIGDTALLYSPLEAAHFDRTLALNHTETSFAIAAGNDK